MRFKVFLKSIEKPTDDAFDYKCDLPHEDPEEVFCGPEFFRNFSRDEFRRNFYSAMLEDKAQMFIEKLMNPASPRCERAIFSILHPFTCVVPPEKTGR